MATIKITGIDKAIRELKQIRGVTPRALGAAMKVEGELIMTKSKGVAPVDTGTLRASGRVGRPSIRGSQVEVVLGYGGAARDYALIQHEANFNHPGQGQRKYLEGPAKAAASGFARRIAARLARAWR